MIADNGLSHNGNNATAVDISDSVALQKTVDVDGSNGTKLLDDASSTTADVPADDVVKKVQIASNGNNQTTATTPVTVDTMDNHQDDDLIRELEQFEGPKKDDDGVTEAVPKPSTEENGSQLQDTSDLLKDLESDSPCPGPSEAETEVTPTTVAAENQNEVEAMDVDQVKKSDDGVDSTTTQTSNKRKHSVDTSDTAAKRANLEGGEDKPAAAAVVAEVLSADTQKSTSEIDSDTESKLLQENSDGEVSMSDVVEAISSSTSTSTVTKTTTTANDVKVDAKPADKAVLSNEDLEVSSSGNVETAQPNVESSKEAKEAVPDASNVSTDAAKAKGDDEVSSNKLNDTTEAMDTDMNETVEAEVSEKAGNVTTNTPLQTNQTELAALDKTSETVASSQPEPVASTEAEPSTKAIGKWIFVKLSVSEFHFSGFLFRLDTTTPQSNDADQLKCNGLEESAASSEEKVNEADSKTDDPVTLPDSVKVEPIPVFEIQISYGSAQQLKSVTVHEVSEKTETVETITPPEPTKHTATGVLELCNFMISHFSAVKKTLNVDDDDAITPKAGANQRGRGSAKKGAASSTQATPKTTKRGQATKRSTDNKSEADESESKSKKVKSDADEVADEETGDCCLARWTDRKYYSGRVVAEKGGNKFAVLFSDGALKNLSAEVIVFGTGNVLPLMDHSVHVLVSDDTYEPGLVTKIDTDGAEVMYTVAAESKTVTCSSSDIYLMDDQAKAIQNSIKSTTGDVTMKTPDTPSSKRTGRLPAKLEETITSSARSSRGKKSQVSPEPGFSGDADNKKSSGRRSNKR